MQSKARGYHAERAAARYLETQGLRIHTSNFSCRAGEIDLIAVEDDSLVFVEVRARRTGSLVDGVDSVSGNKQKRLIRAARFYLHRHGLNECFCRFDLVAVTIQPSNHYDFEWIRNAFDATP